jgi:hypothetical protein
MRSYLSETTEELLHSARSKLKVGLDGIVVFADPLRQGRSHSMDLHRSLMVGWLVFCGSSEATPRSRKGA